MSIEFCPAGARRPSALCRAGRLTVASAVAPKDGTIPVVDLPQTAGGRAPCEPGPTRSLRLGKDDDLGVHPIERFRKRLEDLNTYPSGVVPVPSYLPGTAFFAASAGLYRPAGTHVLPPFPFGGWMLVGHNLDAEGPFLARLKSGDSHGDPARPMRTWQNLYKLLAAAGIDPSECFFTNAYVGLKEGNDPTGRFPGSGNAAFRQWCAEFLLDQAAVMRPRVMATLGVDAARFVASLFPGFRDWDRPRLPPAQPRTAEIRDHRFGVVALVHPSAHHVTLHLRTYDEKRGLEAEAALLLAATPR